MRYPHLIYVCLITFGIFSWSFADEPPEAPALPDYPCTAKNYINGKPFATAIAVTLGFENLQQHADADNQTYFAVCRHPQINPINASSGVTSYIIEYNGQVPYVIDGYEYDGIDLILKGDGPIILRNITITNAKNFGIRIEGKNKTLENVTITGTQVQDSIGLDIQYADKPILKSGTIAEFATGVRILQTTNAKIGTAGGLASDVQIQYNATANANGLPGVAGVLSQWSSNGYIRATIKAFVHGVRIQGGQSNEVDGAIIEGVWAKETPEWEALLSAAGMPAGVVAAGRMITITKTTISDHNPHIYVNDEGHTLTSNILINTQPQGTAIMGENVTSLVLGSGATTNVMTNVVTPYDFPSEDRPEGLVDAALDLGKSCEGDLDTDATDGENADLPRVFCDDVKDDTPVVIFMTAYDKDMTSEQELYLASPLLHYELYSSELKDQEERVSLADDCKWEAFGDATEYLPIDSAADKNPITINASEYGIQCRDLQADLDLGAILYALTPVGAFPIVGQGFVKMAALADYRDPPSTGGVISLTQDELTSVNQPQLADNGTGGDAVVPGNGGTPDTGLEDDENLKNSMGGLGHNNLPVPTGDNAAAVLGGANQSPAGTSPGLAAGCSLVPR